MNPHFKHTVRALVLCSGLLVAGFVLLFHTSAAKSDPIEGLLKLPAPPPPNPLVPKPPVYSGMGVAQIGHPPPDDAPIDDLVLYWTQISTNNYRVVRLPNPSEKSLDRLLAEMRERPEIASGLLRIFPTDAKTGEAVKAAYDALKDDDKGSPEYIGEGLESWLRLNTGYYAADLEKVAVKTHDDESHYVDLNSEQQVLALTTYDWERANPIVTRMYGDHSQPVTQVLATWALYKHALDTDSMSDIDRYRGDLMRTVEDRTLPDGVRDKANDALTHEKGWPGREAWTISLFEDETLVNMQRFTMLRTLMQYEPTEEYIDQLATLLERTSKPSVRTAALQSLVLGLGQNQDPKAEQRALKAMVPWLEDENWAGDSRGDVRKAFVGRLGIVEVPEAVPGLIRLLDEKHTVMVPDYGNYPIDAYGNANRAATNAMIAAQRAMNVAAAAPNAIRRGSNTLKDSDYEPKMKPVEQYTFR
ncbi:MAG: HEAT repeat domain-containing protein, partial [Acidobacteria bacterium]|nr:HEAT repeat domain-containing protein [Acidobacteriota bacterium]